MGSVSDKAIQIQVVKGGFILTTYAEENTTEVFTSQGKLMKALRALLEDAAPEKTDSEPAAE